MNKWIEISRAIFDQVKAYLIKGALLKIFGRVIGGFWGWIATSILGKVIEKYARPLWQKIIRGTYVFFKKIKFKKNAKKLEESESESDFDTNFDNLD